ncbi:MAG: hypothetical protein IJC67_01520 [Clostridia bacterium]|nr:hypothetical protein [Clostridia bacterium]
MKSKRWHIIGFFFTSLMGTLLHFLYEWSGNSPFVALFAAVNESTWEHLKLLVIPFFFFAIFEYFAYGRDHANFAAAKFFGALAGMLTITALFYTYSGILGYSLPAINIAIFYIGVFMAYYVSFRILKGERFPSPTAKLLSLLGIVGLLALFFYFTFYPPDLGIFSDPWRGE